MLGAFTSTFSGVPYGQLLYKCIEMERIEISPLKKSTDKVL